MPVAPRSQRLTAPEDWRVNIGRRTITHINGLVARMEPDPFQKGRLWARPTSLDRLPPRWKSFHLARAMKEAEAAYYAAIERAAEAKAAAMAKAPKLSTDVCGWR